MFPDDHFCWNQMEKEKNREWKKEKIEINWRHCHNWRFYPKSFSHMACRRTDATLIPIRPRNKWNTTMESAKPFAAAQFAWIWRANEARKNLICRWIRPTITEFGLNEWNGRRASSSRIKKINWNWDGAWYSGRPSVDARPKRKWWDGKWV